MERRGQQRCPICHGPTVEDASRPDGVRCRRSTCIYNHSEVKCPRCQSTELAGVDFRNGAFEYNCSDCCHRWLSSKTGTATD